MLDILLFRTDQGGNPDLVRESQKARFADVTLVDQVIELDTEWRQTRGKQDLLNKEANLNKKAIGEFMKKKETPPQELFDTKKRIEEEQKENEKKENELMEKRDKTLQQIGNLVPTGGKFPVKVSDDEDENPVVRTWGKFETQEGWLSHVDLVQLAGIADTEKGSAVAGNRGYFLTDMGALLNNALIQFGMNFMRKRGSKLIQTPFFMRRDMMAKCAQLDDFDEQLYHVTGEGDDKYLIATSEQPICCYHADDWFNPSDLPKKYIGYSTCFRKEVGSHGRDTLGIFRIHQFEKIEQFIFCSPEGEESWEMQEEMIMNSEDFYKELGIPYRVVNIVSGALNDAAAKKYDLEAWFPGSKAHRELVSCSNCTDYQARRLEIRYGQKKAGEAKKVYVHMLNSTLTATERTLCCIMENYQTDIGIKVPDALKPYMHGVEFIPFVKGMPKPKKGQPAPPQHVPKQEEIDKLFEGKKDLEEYLAKHGVAAALNDAVNAIAKERPEDPLKFISDLLAKGASASAKPASGEPKKLTKEEEKELVMQKCYEEREKPGMKQGGAGLVFAADEVDLDGGDATVDDFMDAFA